MRGCAALAPVLFLVGPTLPLSAFQANTAPSSFDVHILLTPRAAAELHSMQEGIVVAATWSANPAPGAESHAGENGIVDLGTENIEVSGRPQIVRVSGAGVHSSSLPYVRGPILVKVTAASAGQSGPDNILNCETFDGKVGEVARKPVTIHCSLISENADAGRPGPIPPSRVADSYAIYALLAPGGPADNISPSQIQNWSLADTTVGIGQMNPAIPPDGQLKAPPDNVDGFNEALRDYQARKNERFHLQSANLHLSRAFDLINEQQIADLRQAAPGNTGVAFFSAVYFNSHQTAALVYVNDWCANLCAVGQWVYLEKHNGQWIRRSGLIASGIGV